MIFSSIKGIAIPEGAVKQIADNAGRIFWKNNSVDVAGLSIGYSGTYTDQKNVTMSGKVYRLLTITGSGTLTVPQELVADVWLCGGGASGANTIYVYGGGGAYCSQLNNVALSASTVCTIGAGGAAASAGSSNGTQNRGNATQFGVNTANGAYGNGGGTGGGQGVHTVSGGAGDGVSKYPFLDTAYFSGSPHCAGGGGGGAYHELDGEYSHRTGGAGGTNGGNGNKGTATSSTTPSGGSGGSKGGGAGGKGGPSSQTAGSNATFYGSGGGGSGAKIIEDGENAKVTKKASGAGYQGVIYVRIPYDQ